MTATKQQEADDPRFSTRRAPQFRRPNPNKQTEREEEKPAEDERFAIDVSDDRFRTDNIPDKYGRKNKKKRQVKKTKKHSKEKEKRQSEQQSRISYLNALARGQLGDLSSSSSSSSEADNSDSSSSSSSCTDNDSDSDDNDDDAHEWLDPTAPPAFATATESTDFESTTYSRFLVVCGLDWTHVRAVDVYALLVMHNVVRCSVVPSDHGRQRMAAESSQGPKLGSTATASDTFEPTVLDPEKVRAYEVESRLWYHYCIVECTAVQDCMHIYQEYNGMEYGRTGTYVDVRLVEQADSDSLFDNRPVRDAWSGPGLPANYVPAEDFTVSALQQSRVECSWEEGDLVRQRILTSHQDTGRGIKKINKKIGREEDDNDEDAALRIYLASDGSSSSEDSDALGKKANNMRRALGLQDDDEDDEESDSEASSRTSYDEEYRRTAKTSQAKVSEESSSSDDGDSDNKSANDPQSDGKEVRFIPGQKASLQTRIETKLSKGGERKDRELTPWEKYQEKRKAKRREKRQAVRERKKQMRNDGGGSRHGSRGGTDGGGTSHGDSLFLAGENDSRGDEQNRAKTLSKADLELLVAGDDDDEEKKDFDMRQIERAAKDQSKNRKRRGQDSLDADKKDEFALDVSDDRFRAVLDGSDERFGIDRTDPKFKETKAMQQILAEQSRRRKRRKR